MYLDKSAELCHLVNANCPLANSVMGNFLMPYHTSFICKVLQNNHNGPECFTEGWIKDIKYTWNTNEINKTENMRRTVLIGWKKIKNRWNKLRLKKSYYISLT